MDSFRFIEEINCMGNMLSDVELYQLARSAGFPPDAAAEMTAIALRESSGVPTAYNGKAPDNSYGLWQINMIGNLKDYRVQLFGLSKPEDLFDPNVNAAAAYKLWSMAGGSPLRDWYEVPVRFMPRAEQAMLASGEGPYADPSAQVPGGSTDVVVDTPVSSVPGVVPVVPGTSTLPAATGTSVLDQLTAAANSITPTTGIMLAAGLLLILAMTGGGARPREDYS